MLHNNINTGSGVILSSRKIIRSRQFLEKKKPAPDSTGDGRKKSAAKKPAPVKGRSGCKKEKQPMESAEPPSETRDEDDSASSSDKTASHYTDDNMSGKEKEPTEEEEQSASLENADTGADGPEEEDVPVNTDQMVAKNIVRRIMEEIDLQAHKAAEVYSEWFGYRCDKFFKHMLPGLTDGQSFRRLKEIEEDVINLTKAKDPNEAMDRHAMVEPHARLQKLAGHIRKLTERYVAGTPKSKMKLLVLDLFAVKKGEFIDEVARLEAVREQQNTTHSPRLETDDDQNPGDQSPLADQAINETDDRTGPHLTDNLESDQVRDSEPAVTKEKVEVSHSRANERITEIEVNYRDDNVLYDAHLRRTVDLEDTTSKLVDDLERFQGKTEQRLTKVDEDMGRSSTEAGSTLDRVITVEEKNALLEERNNKLEADLKAVTEQVNELINAKIAADKAVEGANAQAAKELQDALDEENRKKKEAPRSDANFNERLRISMAKNLELAKTIAAQEVKDAERLNAEKQRLEEYAKAHKKSKAAPSFSVPATRKRKVSARKAQVAEMLGRITETVVEEDDFEEDLEPQPTRQQVFNAVPVSTVTQPFSPHQDTTGAGGSSSRPAQPAKGLPTDELMNEFLPSKLN
ncbi:uncharacterized protein LOC124943593 [Impatiens glandulifera]|uniref:uncharacterized protein LOC124943593 n=1 Tax=Impatiens glandulifera TaxID=253017 RepID=UPI001FB196D3|nr:uncharacterized protein LOC124943593 [Impatiens glandulifera]